MPTSKKKTTAASKADDGNGKKPKTQAPPAASTEMNELLTSWAGMMTDPERLPAQLVDRQLRPVVRPPSPKWMPFIMGVARDLEMAGNRPDAIARILNSRYELNATADEVVAVLHPPQETGRASAKAETEVVAPQDNGRNKWPGYRLSVAMQLLARGTAEGEILKIVNGPRFCRGMDGSLSPNCPNLPRVTLEELRVILHPTPTAPPSGVSVPAPTATPGTVAIASTETPVQAAQPIGKENKPNESKSNGGRSWMDVELNLLCRIEREHPGISDGLLAVYLNREAIFGATPVLETDVAAVRAARANGGKIQPTETDRLHREIKQASERRERVEEPSGKETTSGIGSDEEERLQQRLVAYLQKAADAGELGVDTDELLEQVVDDFGAAEGEITREMLAGTLEDLDLSERDSEEDDEPIPIGLLDDDDESVPADWVGMDSEERAGSGPQFGRARPPLAAGLRRTLPADSDGEEEESEDGSKAEPRTATPTRPADPKLRPPPLAPPALARALPTPAAPLAPAAKQPEEPGRRKLGRPDVWGKIPQLIEARDRLIAEGVKPAEVASKLTLRFGDQLTKAGYPDGITPKQVRHALKLRAREADATQNPQPTQPVPPPQITVPLVAAAPPPRVAETPEPAAVPIAPPARLAETGRPAEQTKPRKEIWDTIPGLWQRFLELLGETTKSGVPRPNRVIAARLTEEFGDALQKRGYLGWIKELQVRHAIETRLPAPGIPLPAAIAAEPAQVRPTILPALEAAPAGQSPARPAQTALPASLVPAATPKYPSTSPRPAPEVTSGAMALAPAERPAALTRTVRTSAPAEETAPATPGVDVQELRGVRRRLYDEEVPAARAIILDLEVIWFNGLTDAEQVHARIHLDKLNAAWYGVPTRSRCSKMDMETAKAHIAALTNPEYRDFVASVRARAIAEAGVLAARLEELQTDSRLSGERQQQNYHKRARTNAQALRKELELPGGPRLRQLLEAVGRSDRAAKSLDNVIGAKGTPAD